VVPRTLNRESCSVLSASTHLPLRLDLFGSLLASEVTRLANQKFIYSWIYSCLLTLAFGLLLIGSISSRSSKAGLAFPVGRVHRLLRKGNYAQRVGAGKLF
jgi:hypothetical protein